MPSLPHVVVDSFAGRQVAVLGLARSGRAAVRALAAGGAQILAWDDDPAVRDRLAAEMPLADLGAADWRQIPALVLSPGIPHSYPQPAGTAFQRQPDAGAGVFHGIGHQLADHEFGGVLHSRW